MNNTETTTYAVFGNPIKHSKSPVIHAAFAEQLGEAITYRAVSVELDDFEQQVSAFFARGGGGLNITVPFKERAFALADECSDRATRAGAANCLIPTQTGGVRADNTDGVGIIRDMVANQGWQLVDRRVLVLGAGGAVRGVLAPLLAEGPASVVIANRTADKARALAALFQDSRATVTGLGLPEIAGSAFDLVINGTSASLAGDMPTLPELVLSDRCCCYDMMYGKDPTPFMRWSAANMAWAVSDGLGMLVEQAAESYFLWRGQRPATGSVIQQIRQLITS